MHRIFTYAKLREYETGRVFWVFNTHFSHRNDDDAQRRRVSQAQVLHQFISDRARRYRICDASFYNEGELVTTQDIAIPFLEPVIVIGDFNSSQGGESGASGDPFGVLTKPLVDNVGGRPTDFFGQLLGGATAFNTPFYRNPSKVPVLSRFDISNAHGTLESTGKIFAPQDDPSTIWENYGKFGGLDWILSNEGFSPLDFQMISHTHDASGDLYTNDNGVVVALSDIHDLLYASFIMTPDRSDQGQGVEIVTPRLFGKSYMKWPLPWSSYYNFDRVVVNGACR